MEPLRVVDLVVKRGSETVLGGISFTLAPRESMAIIGPSGSGKSSLILALAGLIPIQGGAMDLGLPDQEAPGVVLQGLGLFPWKTLGDNVALGLARFRTTKAELAKKVGDILDSFGLLPYQNRYPHELSGGQAQRGALARTLLAQPKLLLLDEPASALDALSREQFYGFLKEIQDQSQCSLILVTHSIPEALAMGDHIAVLHKGQALEVMDNQGRREGGFSNSIHAFERGIQLRKMLFPKESSP